MRNTITVVAWTLLGWALASSALSAEQGFWTRGVPGETDEYKKVLASTGQPLWYVLDDESNVAELIREKCGELSPELHGYFMELTGEINGLQDIGMAIPPGQAVAIPFCNKVSRNVTYTIREGDTISEILQQKTGFHGSKSIRAVAEANVNDQSANLVPAQVDRFAQTIQPSDEIVFPFVSERRLYIPEDPETNPTELVLAYPPVGFDAEIVASSYEMVPSWSQAADEMLNFDFGFTENENETLNVDTASLLGTQAAEVSFVNFVQMESATAPAGCAVGVAVDHYNLGDFVDRVVAEINAARNGGRTIVPGVVGIVDSGLATLGQGMFQKVNFQENLAETRAGSEFGVSDDNNVFKDDIWGMDFENESGRISPYPASTPKIEAHGSQVASLVLGGRQFIESPRIQEPLTKLIIVNFGAQVEDTQSALQLTEALDYLASRGSNIVNMSLSTGAPLAGFTQLLAHRKRDVLLVVAAGNSDPSGRKLDVNIRYPANYGSNLIFPNVITVGSVDSLKKRARFSNFGSPVDLYAPGCGLKTVDNNDSDVIDYGTSMSAAHVSFVASIIRTLGDTNLPPERIKRRLMASADMLPIDDLGNMHYQLNAVRSISIFHDSIEAKTTWTGGKKLRFGKISDINDLRKYCANDAIRPRLDGIVRVTANVASASGTKIKYMLSPDYGHDSETCDQATGKGPIAGYSEDGTAVGNIQITDVASVVAASIRL